MGSAFIDGPCSTTGSVVSSGDTSYQSVADVNTSATGPPQKIDVSKLNIVAGTVGGVA